MNARSPSAFSLQPSASEQSEEKMNKMRFTLDTTPPEESPETIKASALNALDDAIRLADYASERLHEARRLLLVRSRTTESIHISLPDDEYIERLIERVLRRMQT